MGPSFLLLHIHLRGKDPSPQPRLPQSSARPDPTSPHPNATSLPVLLSAQFCFHRGGLAYLALPLLAGEQPVLTTPHHIKVSPPPPTASPLTPALSAVSLPAFVSSPAPTSPVFYPHSEHHPSALSTSPGLLSSHRPSWSACPPRAQAARPQTHSPPSSQAQSSPFSPHLGMWYDWVSVKKM